ncbi:2-succinyl-5-enolpyruvyl-6-hydroxy-3-cyclohexene-1-carboxylic-acid synthase, partial [bacterium]|nr:2-succinyl-5-enolpyruvyl-6-hydroxy-3-cyclohexene-1-carboxylic-acid synthase [bacterium]
MGRVESQNSGDIGSFIVNAMALGVEVIHALATAGVQHVGVAPGSRSTPLAVAVADNSSIEHTVHFDERGLGFWAVGVAQAKRVPVGVIVTSGTAVANLLPAVIEANYSGLPLIILSADRPQELIDVGANQAIRQSRLLAEHCRFAVDLHVPSSAHEVRYWASAIAEAIHRAIGPTPGPVHINFRFREPFHAPFISPSKFPDIRMPATKSLESRANTFRVDSNAIIIIGALVADPTIVLSQVREWNRPILLDGASGISGTFPGGNWVPTDYCPPSIFEGVEQIIHIGGRLLSKSLGQWLSHWDGDYVHITETSDRQDPMSLAKTQIVGLDGILSAQVDLPDMLFNLRFSKWSQYFTAKLSVAASSEWSELGLLYEVIRRIPESWAGFVGNSLTVRLWSYLRGFAPTVRR